MGDEVPIASVKVEGIETVGTLKSVDVEDNDRLIDKATTVFDDVDGIAAATMLEQRQIVIELGWTCARARVFEGIVWRVKTETRSDVAGSKQQVTLVALDLSYKMNQGEGKAKVYPPGKLSDILKSIVAPYTIPVGAITLGQDPQFTADAPLVKGPKTDWAFIQELAVRYGARAFVEVNNDKSQFYFVSEQSLLNGDSTGAVTYQYGTSPLIEFTYQRVASGAAPVSSATVSNPVTGTPTSKQAPTPPPEAPLSADPDEKSRLDKLGTGAGALYSGAIDVVSKSAGQAEDARAKQNVTGLPSDPDLADSAILQDPTRTFGFLGHGIAVGNVQIRAKSKMTIKGLAPWANSDWYVRRANHQITTGAGADKKGEASGTYRTRFTVTK